MVYGWEILNDRNMDGFCSISSFGYGWMVKYSRFNVILLKYREMLGI